MKKINFSKLLYFFLFSNTLIAGLFNFLITPYLTSKGVTYSGISLFIAVTALTFFIFLFFIEYLINKFSISILIFFTFIAYTSYITSIFFLQIEGNSLLLFGIIGGIYSSLFWTLQRLFFIETISNNNTGKKFGNLQIFVGILSQISILIGTFLLEFYNFEIVYFLSIILLIIFIGYNYLRHSTKHFMRIKKNTIKSIIMFKDDINSKSIFIIDGIFLSLESHFWLLIIFLFVKNDFFEVGKIVTLLAALFFIIYVFIKNKVDHTNIKKVFFISTILYSISWLLRFSFMFINNIKEQYILIYVIGFLTLFFRLTFNKIFFENAKNRYGTNYIFLKSYYSQFFIFISFLIISLTFFLFNNSMLIFNILFIIASLTSFLYLRYTSAINKN